MKTVHRCVHLIMSKGIEHLISLYVNTMSLSPRSITINIQLWSRLAFGLSVISMLAWLIKRPSYHNSTIYYVISFAWHNGSRSIWLRSQPVFKMDLLLSLYRQAICVTQKRTTISISTTSHLDSSLYHLLLSRRPVVTVSSSLHKRWKDLWAPCFPSPHRHLKRGP